MKKTALFAGTVMMLVPHLSEAHIKWFCAYDTTVPPLPVKDVLTPAFVLVATGFLIIMFIAYIVDHRIDRSRWAGWLDRMILLSTPNIPLIVRAAVGALFVSLWATGGVILTPELKTNIVLIPWLQLAIAAAMLCRATLFPGAFGILGLYAYATEEYGAFHLMDYPIFPGVAVYLGMSEIRSLLLQQLRLPVLYTSVAITMMWGAVEKFGYPYWSFPLLATHEGLALGLPFDRFMNIAGFVEFSLAFFMLTGTALLRFSCLGLLALLTSAVPEFGKIDAVGHLLIMAGLIAMVIAGQHSIQLPALVRCQRSVARAGILTLGYGTTLAAFFGLYYGSQYLAGR